MSSRSPLRSPFARLLSLLAGVALLSSACGDASGSAESASDDATRDTQRPSGPTVVVASVAFEPETIKIASGETVTWVFRDKSLPHNVVGDDFKSPQQRSGNYRRKFTEEGTYTYRCTLHPAMKGTVEVTD